MNIKIITVGKLKEKYLVQGINEYVKRLGAYVKIQLVEVPDEKAPENLSEAEMLQVKEKEGQRILAKIKEQEYVYALAIEGKNPSSEDFAKQIDQHKVAIRTGKPGFGLYGPFPFLIGFRSGRYGFNYGQHLVGVGNGIVSPVPKEGGSIQLVRVIREILPRVGTFM